MNAGRKNVDVKENEKGSAKGKEKDEKENIEKESEEKGKKKSVELKKKDGRKVTQPQNLLHQTVTKSFSFK